MSQPEKIEHPECKPVQFLFPAKTQVFYNGHVYSFVEDTWMRGLEYTEPGFEKRPDRRVQATVESERPRSAGPNG